MLEDSEFVMQVLSEAGEAFDRRYELKSQGYGIAKVEKRIIDVFGIERDDLYSGRRKKPISEARSVFCYWCVKELSERQIESLDGNRVGFLVELGSLPGEFYVIHPA